MEGLQQLYDNLIAGIAKISRYLYLYIFILILAIVFAFMNINILMKWILVPAPKEVTQFIFVTPIETMTTQLKLSFLAALYVTIPVLTGMIFYGLANNYAKKMMGFLIPFAISVFGMFTLGAWLGYSYLLPFVLKFLFSLAPAGIDPMISLGKYIDFCVGLIFVSGLVFEIPPLMFLLAYIGLMTSHVLAKARKWVIVGAFIAGAILSPSPDIISQSVLAVVIWGLYEIGLVLMRMIKR